VDISEELKTKENVQMTQKKRQIFTEEQKADVELIRPFHRRDVPTKQKLKLPYLGKINMANQYLHLLIQQLDLC
jgi:hypothetical protein